MGYIYRCHQGPKTLILWNIYRFTKSPKLPAVFFPVQTGVDCMKNQWKIAGKIVKLHVWIVSELMTTVTEWNSKIVIHGGHNVSLVEVKQSCHNYNTHSFQVLYKVDDSSQSVPLLMSGVLICIVQWTHSLKDPHLYQCHSQLHGQHDILCNTYLRDSYRRLPQSIDIKTINKCWTMTLLSSFILFVCDLFSFDFLRECSGKNFILKSFQGIYGWTLDTLPWPFIVFSPTSIFKSCSLCKVSQWHNIEMHILLPFN